MLVALYAYDPASTTTPTKSFTWSGGSFAALVDLNSGTATDFKAAAGAGSGVIVGIATGYVGSGGFTANGTVTLNTSVSVDAKLLTIMAFKGTATGGFTSASGGSTTAATNHGFTTLTASPGVLTVILGAFEGTTGLVTNFSEPNFNSPSFFGTTGGADNTNISMAPAYKIFPGPSSSNDTYTWTTTSAVISETIQLNVNPVATTGSASASGSSASTGSAAFAFLQTTASGSSSTTGSVVRTIVGVLNNYTHTGASLLLDAVTGRVTISARPVYFALLTGDITPDATLATMPELVATGYARAQAVWEIAPDLVNSIPKIYNYASTTIPSTTMTPGSAVGPGLVTHVALVTAASGTSGDILAWWAMDSINEAFDMSSEFCRPKYRFGNYVFELFVD